MDGSRRSEDSRRSHLEDPWPWRLEERASTGPVEGTN